MKTFSEFVQIKEQEQPVASNQQLAGNTSFTNTSAEKTSEIKTKWKASKKEILTYWRTLRGDSPIRMNPIPYLHKGSTYGEDGIRINGSPVFIASVIGRLKDILNYESPTTKLAVSYRQAESKKMEKNSYVFYISARERGKKIRQKNVF
jgi:hypothetical protein